MRRFRRHVYVTPKSYLSFLAGFRDLYERKLAHVRGLASAIAAGLAKMKEAKVDVGRMKARCPRICHIAMGHPFTVCSDQICHARVLSAC